MKSEINFKTEEIVLLDYVQNKSFIIPLYQRRYKWTKNNIQTLIDDLFLAWKNKKNFYWLGVLTFQQSGGKYIVVDGQQRIITMILISKIFNDLSVKYKKLDIEDDVSKRFDVFENNKENGSNPQEIIDWIKNENKKNLEDTDLTAVKIVLNKRRNLVNEFHKSSEKKSFINFITKKVIGTAVYVENQQDPNQIYRYFENNNSKGRILTLTDKCLSFLLGEKNYEKGTLSKKSLFKWLLSEKKGSAKILLKAEKFFEMFIKIFCGTAHTDDHFTNFKKWITENDKNIKYFYNYLEETKKFINDEKSEKKSFEICYLKRICFKNYWFLWVKILTLKNEKFEKQFLNLVWRFDIVKHIGAAGSYARKTTIEKLIWVCKSENGSIIQNFEKIMKTYLRVFEDVDNSSLKKLIWNINLEHITYASNYSKRFLAFFHLLYLQQSTQLFDTIKKELTIEHLVAEKSEEGKKLQSQIQKLANIGLLDKKHNASLSNKNLKNKISEIQNLSNTGSLYAFCFPLVNEIIEDYRRAEKISKDKNEKLRIFWKNRNKSLFKKIDDNKKNKRYSMFSINWNHKLNYNENTSGTNFKNLIEKLVKNWGLEHLNGKFYRNKTGKVFYFGKLNYKGKKTPTELRMQVKPDDITQIKNLLIQKKNVSVIAFNRETGRLYKYFNKGFATKKKNTYASLHFTSSKWQDDWEEIKNLCNLI